MCVLYVVGCSTPRLHILAYHGHNRLYYQARTVEVRVPLHLNERVDEDEIALQATARVFHHIEVKAFLST